MSKYSKKFNGGGGETSSPSPITSSSVGTSSSSSSSPSSSLSSGGKGRLEHRRRQTTSAEATSTTPPREVSYTHNAEETVGHVAGGTLETARSSPEPLGANTTAPVDEMAGESAASTVGLGVTESQPATQDKPTARSTNRDEGENSDEEEFDDKDLEDDMDADGEGDKGGVAETNASQGKALHRDGRMNGTSHSKTFYACDMCPHLVFSSADALQTHAITQHSDVVPDFATLTQVSSKLVPLWDKVRERKAATIRQWGKKVFHIARQRDAGPAKMAEAHRAREQLEHVVQRWHANARVFIFGSSVTFGVWDGISDIDFTVVDVAEMEAGTWPPQEKNAVRSITELLRRAGFSYVNLEPIPHARVPIIKHHASAPIRITSPRRHHTAAASEASADEPELTEEEAEEASRWEAEDVISRSVRYTLSGPASRQDRVVLEGSIRDAIGADAVQQVWWNRTGEMMCVTCDTTLNAMRAATCGLSFVTPGMRARVQPLHDECRPELYNIDFDLSFRAFGIRNSDLLNRYLTAHPCARPGAIVLKDWSKTSGVNNSINGYLTSYAVNIMWIYYLIQRGVLPYIDPILDVPASLVGRTNYGPTYSPMMPTNPSEEQLEALYTQAGELLLDFFFFYAHEFDWQNDVVSLNRKGRTTKKMLGWDQEDGVGPASLGTTAAAVASSSATTSTGAAGVSAPSRRSNAVRYTFCIEDPYEENLNLGRHMGITKALRVQTEFHRGLLSLLKDGEHDSCVFASTDRTEEAAAAAAAAEENGASDSSGGADALAKGGLLSSASSTPPGRLPLRVLHRLMGVAIREMAKAKRDAMAQQDAPPQHLGHGKDEAASSLPAASSLALLPTSRAFAGVKQENLFAAFKRDAPVEYQLASKAWNSQQLLHRLGYKLHRGRVLPRREIGVRRLSAHPQPPEGVLAASTALASSPSAALSSSSMTALPASTMGLSERMASALAQGFLRLTPEWVAWSKPWAALHLRGFTLFTPSRAVETNGAGSSSSNSKHHKQNSAQKMHAQGIQTARQGSGGGGGGGGGGMKPTAPQRMRVLDTSVTMAAAAIRVSSAQALKRLFRK